MWWSSSEAERKWLRENWVLKEMDETAKAEGNMAEELARKYPGEAESLTALHLKIEMLNDANQMTHRKLDTLINQMNELLQRIDPGYDGLPNDTGGG